MTSFLSVLTFLKCFNQIPDTLFRHQSAKEQYVGILCQSKLFSYQTSLLESPVYSHHLE